MSSIKEIARRAKTSIGTVDRVLHNRGRVARDTEERIKKAIKELKYRPNIFARNLKLTKTFTFGVLIPRQKQDNRFWEIPMQGIKKAQKELENQKVKVTYFYYDRTSEQHFIKIAYPLLNMNLDGLLIAPVLYEQAEKFVKKIPSSLPFVFIDSRISESKYLSYIGQDPYQSGFLSAKLMKLLIPSGGMIAIINIIPRYFFIEERIKGFFTFFRNDLNYQLKVYTLDSKNADTGSGILTESIIRDNRNIKGLFIPGGPVARFAEYICNNNLTGSIRTIGYDLTRENKAYCRNGTVDFLISQSPEIQGYQGIYALYRHCVLKEKPPKETILPIDIVTKENIDYF